MTAVAERQAYRAKCLSKYGMECAIPESIADAIREIVAKHWVIVAEDFSGPTLRFSVNPRTDVSTRARADAETMLSKTYGGWPHAYSTRFTNYELTFNVN